MSVIKKSWYKGKLSSGEEFLDSLKMAIVLRDRKTVIKGWKFDYEASAGGWFWENDEYPDVFIIANLFWEQEKAVDFEIRDEDGSNILLNILYTFSPSDDFDYDLIKYVTLLDHFLRQPETKKVLNPAD